MRSRLLAIFAAAIAAVTPALAQEQNSEIIQVAPDMFLRWYGHDGRTYFVQVSDPNDHLRKWTWAPIIESGNDENISYEVDGTADKGFFRLWFSDQPTTDPDGDDFDYDGSSNWDEVAPTRPTRSSGTATPTACRMIGRSSMVLIRTTTAATIPPTERMATRTATD